MTGFEPYYALLREANCVTATDHFLLLARPLQDVFLAPFSPSIEQGGR